MDALVSLKPLPFTGGTVVYRIVNGPSYVAPGRSLLSPESVAGIIASAFAKWSLVSDFDFVPAPLGAPDSACHISLRFGSLDPFRKNGIDPATAAAVTLNAEVDGKNGRLREIVFNDRLWWVGPEILGSGGKWDRGILWFVTKLFDLALAVVLEAVAVHEIGHALGLPHNSTNGSVMNADLSILNQTHLYYLADQDLDDVDAEALAGLYRAAKVAVPASSEGYAIVGSTFSVSNMTSSIIFKHVPRLCWGDRLGPQAPLARCYAFNPFAGAEGFAHWDMFLMPDYLVGAREYVVGGGMMVPISAVTRADLAGDELLREQQAGLYAGYKILSTWGRQSGSPVLAARARTYNDALQTDTDSLAFFWVATEKSGIPPLCALGCKTTIGDEGYSELSRYDALEWGVQTGGNTCQTLRARTWSNTRPNAYSMTYLLTAKA